MKEWARWFYISKSWRQARKNKMIQTFGLCELCGRPAEIVHHKIYITPENIYDQSITLSEENLMCVCMTCHMRIHTGSKSTADGLLFDEDGKLREASEDE